jgi:hypothetical protein
LTYDVRSEGYGKASREGNCDQQELEQAIPAVRAQAQSQLDPLFRQRPEQKADRY